MRHYYLSLAVLCGQPGLGQTAQTAAPQAPPPAPAPMVRSALVSGRHAQPAAGLPVLWDIGQPADAEQKVLELINGARANPVAEALRLEKETDYHVRSAYDFFRVDFARFKADMALIPPLPPLAPSAQLTTAARGHSQWMLDHAQQVHFEGGLDASARVTAVGYPWSIVGENIYAYSENPVHAHASFEVDWGLFDPQGKPTTPGMQNPPGHRLNNHDGRYREVGVGLVSGLNTVGNGTVGPMLFTINFADRLSASPLVTGVVYFDLNANGAYDPGEGIGGIRVDVSDAGYFGQTPTSGGYAVPSTNGTHTVTFSAPGLSPVSRLVTLSDGENVKADLALPYPAPTLAGPTAPSVGQTSSYQPSPLPAATAYKWDIAKRRRFDTQFDAETGPAGLAIQSTPGYQVLQNFYFQAGSMAYRLTHRLPEDQVLRVSSNLMGGAHPVLHFAVAFGYATPTQVLTAEVSKDDGATWTAVWSMAGHAAPPEPFTLQNVPLTDAVQNEIQVRFRFVAQPNGPYYNTLGSGEGVYLDSISFEDVYELINVATGQIAASAQVPFTPTETGDFALGVQPVVGIRVLPRGPKLQVVAGNAPPPPPVVHLGVPALGPNGRLRIDFDLLSGTAAGYVLERSDAPGEPWKTDASAEFAVNLPGNFTFRATPTGASALYRVRAQ